MALFLRSGDALIMGGASRLRYHAVPRVLAGSAPAALKGLGGTQQGEGRADAGGADGGDKDAGERKIVHEGGLREGKRGEWAAKGVEALRRVHAALGHDVRLNINVRQVLPEGGTFPDGAEESPAEVEACADALQSIGTNNTACKSAHAGEQAEGLAAGEVRTNVADVAEATQRAKRARRE